MTASTSLTPDKTAKQKAAEQTTMPINKCDRLLEMLSKCALVVVLLCGIAHQTLVEALRERIPLVRLPSNTLLKYSSYKDVSILHFDVPADTRTAYFNFKAYEEAKGAFRKLFISIFLPRKLFICTFFPRKLAN